MVKTITVTEEAYLHLKEMKKEEESFTKLIERLYHQKKPINLDDFIGILSEEQGKELEKLSKEARNSIDAGFKKRARQLGSK